METKEIPLEEVPYGEYLKILRKEGYADEADAFEEEFTRVFYDLGYSKEDLLATSLKSVEEIIKIYSNEVQRQLTLSMVGDQSFSISGTVLAGKDIDEDRINRVAALQMRKHENHKNRMMVR